MMGREFIKILIVDHENYKILNITGRGFCEWIIKFLAEYYLF